MMEVLLKTNNMKISEVIQELQEIQYRHGDVEVSNSNEAVVTGVLFKVLTRCAALITEDDEL